MESNNRTNHLNLDHIVRDIRGKEVLFGSTGEKLTLRTALIESLSVQVQGLGEQIERADLAKKILTHNKEVMPVSGPTRALLGTVLGAYPWPSIIIPNLLEQVDPERLEELRAK
ncbi:MAG: hypothetical protein HQL72_05515 [Magnetococcales bacterium]|nr:hypothetical protein [Magnetococcales bacterium]